MENKIKLSTEIRLFVTELKISGFLLLVTACPSIK